MHGANMEAHGTLAWKRRRTHAEIGDGSIDLRSRYEMLSMHTRIHAYTHTYVVECMHVAS
jgi:hypothetical protein